MAGRYLFGAGGTSGHINPAIAIADFARAKEPDAEILFCGGDGGLEAEMTARSGYTMTPIRASIAPHGARRMRAFLWENTAGLFESLRLLKAFRPTVVIGTGGYAASPLVLAALLSRTPVILHEQNAFPGRSNRLFAPYVRAVCISFAESGKYFSRRTKLVLSGNPVREAFFTTTREAARAELNLPDDTFFVLVLGGSLGAQTLCEAVAGLAEEPRWRALADRRSVEIFISTGHSKAATYLSALRRIPGVKADAYVHNVPVLMAAADLFVGRAGAITCSELAAVGTPSILVPYPHAANDHQRFNATSMEAAGAAWMVADDELTTATLLDRISVLLDDETKRRDMATMASRLAVRNALDVIYHEMKRVQGDGQA